jgi:hypothetical protein
MPGCAFARGSTLRPIAVSSGCASAVDSTRGKLAPGNVAHAASSIAAKAASQARGAGSIAVRMHVVRIVKLMQHRCLRARHPPVDR